MSASNATTDDSAQRSTAQGSQRPDISSYTHKWRAKSNTTQTGGSKVTKRNRPPVSCHPCRVRKMRCDRGHPCDGCVKRDEAELCVYGKAPTTTVYSARNFEQQSGSTMQDRLSRLEDMVRQMVPSPEPDPPASMHNTPGEAQLVEGPLERDRHGKEFTGSTHWSAVLDQIQELKTSILEDASPDSYQDDLDDNKLSSIFGAPSPPPLSTILDSYLPSRQQVDRAISTYFNAPYMTMPCIHVRHFQRQYDSFWDNQLETSPVWISLLFSVMCIGDIIRQGMSMNQSGTLPSVQESYKIAAAQCLVLGEYTKPQPTLLEALIAFAQCHYLRTLDPNREVGTIFAVLARMAYTMGYHRDPSKFPRQFTPFEGEMRRRVWASIKMSDMMLSFQLGIPMSIQQDSWDTAVPRNILDVDFDEDTTELPPARPDTEPSQMLYFTVKSRVMDVYARVCHHALSFPKIPPTEENIMAFDAEIRRSAESVPAVLRVRPMSQSYSDPAYLIQTRWNLANSIWKSLCVLHRRHMTTKDRDYSRRACTEAATSLVGHFVDVSQEFEPGGQLYNDRWMLSSFNIDDFLLATMLLAYTFWFSRKRFFGTREDIDIHTWLRSDEEATAQYRLLQKARGVCDQYSQRSSETRRVSQALAYVLSQSRPGTWRNVPDVARSQHSADSARSESNMWTTVDAVPRQAGNPGPDSVAQRFVPLSIGEGGSVDPMSSRRGNETAVRLTQREAPSLDWNSVSFYNALSDSESAMTTQQPPSQPQSTNSGATPASVPPSVPNVVGGPSQIDWTSFDQFLGPYTADLDMMDDERVMFGIDPNAFDSSGPRDQPPPS